MRFSILYVAVSALSLSVAAQDLDNADIQAAASSLIDSGILKGGSILGQPAASAVASIASALGTATGTAAAAAQSSVLADVINGGLSAIGLDSAHAAEAIAALASALNGADFASGLRSAAQDLLDSGDLEGGTILGQPAASAVSSIVAALGTETGTAALPAETSVLFGLVGEGLSAIGMDSTNIAQATAGLGSILGEFGIGADTATATVATTTTAAVEADAVKSASATATLISSQATAASAKQQTSGSSPAVSVGVLGVVGVAAMAMAAL